MNSTFRNQTDVTVKPLLNDLYFYILPVIVVTGSLGNAATLVVFSRGKFRKMSLGVYMLAYSFMNLLNLVFIFGESWIVDVFSVYGIVNLADWTCKVWNFLSRVISYSCVWLIVALTIDRYIYVCHHIDAKRLCTVFLAKAAVVFITVGLTVTSVHAMWSYYTNDKGECHLRYPDQHVNVWRWITMCIYCLIPFFALFFLNLRICIGLCRKKKQMLKSNHSYVFTRATQAISITYLLLITPATIRNIKEYFEMPRLDLFRAISDFLTCGNPTIFFFICLIFSKTFRSELMTLIKRKEKTEKQLVLNLSKISKYEYIECASETFV